MTADSAPPGRVTLGEIFCAFLLIGATSFGGGVLAYLRSSLVDKHRWIDDPTFVQMLAMSQSLPGLNSSNMAVLVGDRLRGAVGAAAAVVGAAGAIGAEVAPVGPPGGSVGSLMVGAAEGLGGRLIRTVSFLGWTLPVSFFGGTAPLGTFGIFSAITNMWV